MIARVSFIRTAERKPIPNSIKKMIWPGVLAKEKKRHDIIERYPLSTTASPMINIPSKKSITSILIACSASVKEICPVRITARAPPSIICQILRLYAPTCRIAISRNVKARMTTAIYVRLCFCSDR
jgi:hypothetical protein